MGSDDSEQLNRIEALLSQMLALLLTLLETATADDDQESLMDLEGQAHGSSRSMDVL